MSYSGTVYNLTSKITTYNADTALLQSQPWFNNVGLAQGLAPLVGGQLGTYLSYTPGGPPHNALFLYNNATSVVESLICTSGNCSTGGTSSFNFVILGQPLITLNDLSSSLTSTSQGIDTALVNANLMLNGAHSRPLSRRVATGQKTGWMLGDWGRDDHGSRDGTTGLAELGGGYNFGPAQINVSAGRTWSGQSLAHNGKLDFGGHYVMAEALVPVAGVRNLTATLGVYGHWGEADILRGYLVSGAQNFSTGSPDSQTTGMRARLDWENAFAAANTQFSPYADLSHAESRLDAYTETGGAFPATYNKRKDRATDLRIGVNAAKPIPATAFTFIGNIEAARRVSEDADAASGTVTGLFAFDLPGANQRRNWLKAGVGVEGLIGQGKASIMLNATTNGEMPNAWLAASYQLTF